MCIYIFNLPILYIIINNISSFKRPLVANKLDSKANLCIGLVFSESTGIVAPPTSDVPASEQHVQ